LRDQPEPVIPVAGGFDQPTDGRIPPAFGFARDIVGDTHSSIVNAKSPMVMQKRIAKVLDDLAQFIADRGL
jgi:hypothetical protein